MAFKKAFIPILHGLFSCESPPCMEYASMLSLGHRTPSV